MKTKRAPWNKGIKQSAEVLKAKQRAYYLANRAKIIAQTKINRDNKPEKYKPYQKWYHIFKKYGLTQSQYTKMLTEQNGLCKVCTDNQAVVVDHCHLTGKVRGLLCHRCNHGLHILDVPGLLELAQRYLNESK